MKKITALFAMLAVSSTTLAGVIPTYAIVDIGQPQGRSAAYAINDRGQVAGASFDESSGRISSFIYSGGTVGMLGLFGSTNFVAAINNYGSIAGTSTVGDRTLQHAYLYNGAAIDLGTGFLMSSARGINDANQVVGYTDGVDGKIHAFLYGSGAMTLLPDFGGFGSGAEAINNSGVIVGYSLTTGNAETHAFSYNGEIKDIGTLGGTLSSAEAINDQGEIVGYSTIANDSPVTHAFIFDGQMHDLGTLGGRDSYANAINSDGIAVGNSYLPGDVPGDALPHAALFGNGAVYDLNALSSAAQTGWTLQTALDINASGQIVGVGTLNGVTRGFLLVPNADVPEPASIFLILAGLCGLATASAFARRH